MRRVANYFRVALLFVILIAGCSPPMVAPTAPRARPTPSPVKTNTAQQLERYLTRQTNRSDFSGVVLIARGGEILLHRAYGAADAQQNIVNTIDTRFQLASVAKTLTATAILQLVAQNKINLESRISNYLPVTPSIWNDITIQQLLSHTSGIPDYFTLDEFAAEKNFTPDKIIAVAKTYPLDFEPGSDFEYSNTNYILLGKIIETVSQHSYAEFLRGNIFDPLQMNATGRAENNAPLAIGYASPRARADIFPITNALGDGDLLSTVGDLYKFDRALYDDKFLARDLREKMFASVGSNHYGLGWEIQTWNGKRVVKHNGSVPGFSAEFMRFPDDDAVIIILSNNEAYDVTQAAWALAEILFP